MKTQEAAANMSKIDGASRHSSAKTDIMPSDDDTVSRQFNRYNQESRDNTYRAPAGYDQDEA